MSAPPKIEVKTDGHKKQTPRKQQIGSKCFSLATKRKKKARQGCR